MTSQPNFAAAVAVALAVTAKLPGPGIATRICVNVASMDSSEAITSRLPMLPTVAPIDATPQLASSTHSMEYSSTVPAARLPALMFLHSRYCEVPRSTTH